METLNAPIWERQPGEREIHYEWFHAWLLLGPARSHTEAYKSIQDRKGLDRTEKPLNVSGAWRLAAERWKWKERAAMWDVEQQREKEELHRERERALDEKRFRLREKMLEKAEKMLDFPLVKVTTNNGQTTIEPARWNLNSAARLLEVEQKLAGDSDIVKHVDLSSMTEDQLLRLRNGEDIYKVLAVKDSKQNDHHSA